LPILCLATAIKYQRIAVFLLIVNLLISCSANHGLTTEAQEVLDKTARYYYTSPWMGSTHFQVLNEVEIRNAWRAKGVESGDMWCVELEVSGRIADRPKAISAVWILIRQDDQSDWQAAALETISASSTIERCEL
jgi:hypothetical protein